MKISQVKIKNFRGYKKETTINIDDLTVFVGKNDVGKSTLLEALDIFFNDGKGSVKLDKGDINKFSQNDDIEISVVFEVTPREIIIDSANATTLEDEYLLNKDKKLEIIKRYPKAGKEKVFIRAYHPSNSSCNDLLLKTQDKLKGIVDSKSIICSDKRINAEMRKAIWGHYQADLNLEEREIDATKEDAKKIWEHLKKYMPLYALFQSDRENKDNDSEIQDPMKLAVQEIIKSEGLKDNFDDIAEKILGRLNQVVSSTLEKLKEMNPDVANSLNPVIPDTENLKWADVFKNVSISGDEGIPINKRGSGVKRLILLNFFRAEAERRRNEKDVPSIIYAIEEPETSQHQDHQSKLIGAFIKLSEQRNTQVLLTTHSSSIVKMMGYDNLRLVSKDEDVKVIAVDKRALPFKSLNEVNFIAFDYYDESYHNELYGFIVDKGWFGEYKKEKTTITYVQKNIDGSTKPPAEKVLSEYIRHQIHHPENKVNRRFTTEELRSSIHDMREFIISKS